MLMLALDFEVILVVNLSPFFGGQVSEKRIIELSIVNPLTLSFAFDDVVFVKVGA